METQEILLVVWDSSGKGSNSSCGLIGLRCGTRFDGGGGRRRKRSVGYVARDAR